MNQTPSVGRIVHVHVALGVARPAIITCVHSESVVDLIAFNVEEPVGNNIVRHVPVQPWMHAARGEAIGNWFWPPHVSVATDAIDVKRLANELEAMDKRLNVIAAQLYNISAPPMLLQAIQRVRIALEAATDEAAIVYK